MHISRAKVPAMDAHHDQRLSFMAGGGECGELARSIDWAKTPLGPVSSWPTSLRTAVGLVLHSEHPMFLFWGPELIQIYNDAFIPSFGHGKHPKAMGQRGRDCWTENWPIVGPQITRVMNGEHSAWNEDSMVPMQRNGRLEEVYWTYAYSPIFDDDGVSIGGTIVVCSETTSRVLTERRTRTLRTFADRIATVTAVAELGPMAFEVLRDAALDVPFVLGYTLDSLGLLVPRDATHESPELVETVNEALAAHITSFARDGTSLPFSSTLTFPPIDLWSHNSSLEPLKEALVVLGPRQEKTETQELIVFGLSPSLPFDDSYREHLELLVESITQTHCRIEACEARLNAESERRNLLLQAPVPAALLVGKNHVFELANPAWRELAGREVVGKTCQEAFPELEGTALPNLVDRVYTSGKAFNAAELCVTLKDTSPRWFKVNLRPVFDASERVRGVMVIAVDVTDMCEARQQVEVISAERKKLLDDVQAANRSKDEFLAMLGHELRNPLAPITTALHLMRLRESGEYLREREIIERQAAHLVQLVDDLLDVSRIARGKISLSSAPVSIAVIITNAVEMASPLFEQRRHSLELDLPKRTLEIEGDRLRLAQVFANLLTNAAKYTEPGGAISVKARRDGNEVVVQVKDSGIGIPPEQLPHIFDAFFQGPQKPDRALGGLGLGLALVQSLLTLHGASVSAASEGVGRGSTFEVRLKACPELHVTAPSLGAEPRPSSDHVAPRVLLVDDSEDIVELMTDLLRMEGFEVLSAHDGPSALRVAPEFHPDFAVLDIGLPAMDGYDLALHLREELGEHAPFMIAMTGYGQEADRERARLAGFDVHLVKPVDPARLIASLRVPTARPDPEGSRSFHAASAR